MRDIRTRLQSWAWGALLLGALVCSARLSPVAAFQPRPQLGLALSLLGGGALLLSRTHPALHPLRWVGAAVLWACLCWCVLSQPMPLTRPPSLEWSLRGVPLILAAALWLWLVLRAPLLRRAVAAALLPSLVALALVAWSSPPHPLTFAPYYLAVDSHGTLYATDAAAPVIRVFAGWVCRAPLPTSRSRSPYCGPGRSARMTSGSAASRWAAMIACTCPTGSAAACSASRRTVGSRRCGRCHPATVLRSGASRRPAIRCT